MAPATVLRVTQLMVLVMAAVGRRHPYPNTKPDPILQNLYRGALAVDAWSTCSEVNPWEVGSLVEGDLLDVKAVSTDKVRIVTTLEEMKWTNKTIPYHINMPDFSVYDAELINGVIEEVNQYKCVTFRRATVADKNYLRISGRRGGCYATGWGMIGGGQWMNLQRPQCLQRGTIFHLIFHVLGFWHLHNNPIRDDYITINFYNVIQGYESFFHKYENYSLTDYYYRYDYGSIMHASRKAHSKNGQDTITTHDPLVTIGQRLEPSFFDIQKLLKLYDCDKVDDNDYYDRPIENNSNDSSPVIVDNNSTSGDHGAIASNSSNGTTGTFGTIRTIRNVG